MNFVDGVLHIESFLAITLGIIVLFLGRRLTQMSYWLKEFSIPEPVSGGILVSILFAILHYVTQIDVSFDLATRDLLLVYFFTTIGINASLRDLFNWWAWNRYRMGAKNWRAVRFKYSYGDRYSKCNLWTYSCQFNGWTNRKILN